VWWWVQCGGVGESGGWGSGLRGRGLRDEAGEFAAPASDMLVLFR
jgi:hypothetical protein